MPASPFAAPPSASDGPVMREAPLRICIYALDGSSATELGRLRARLPGNARLALFGPCADAVEWPQAERVREIAFDGGQPDAVLAAAAARYPGEDLVLVRADLDLPEFACERLLRALEAPDVLGALPLDGVWLRPMPADPGTRVDAHVLDALCYAYSDRALLDDPHPSAGAVGCLSAWHGARLARPGDRRRALTRSPGHRPERRRSCSGMAAFLRQFCMIALTSWR
jgi:hypothetical protein